MTTPLLEVRDLRRHYVTGRTLLGRSALVVKAVDGVSFTVGHGETLGIVGESGSGKSTLGRLVLRLEEPTSGRVIFNGRDISDLTRQELKPLRKEMQVVFQDPYSSLNPRMPVWESVVEPLTAHGLAGSRSEKRDKAASLFARVGLDPKFLDRLPHQFSGGQRQRIGIARAIALAPRLIVADEPITALDVSIQAQIVNLFLDLQEELGLGYLFITHDLRMVEHLCHRVAVMLRGRIVEIGETAQVFENPQHAYTRALISAAPIPDPAQEALRQRIAYETGPPPEEAVLREVTPGHWALAA